jgi:mRNA interferase MazF
MGRFVKGDVVVLPFPFSDLTTSKKRPALVVASLKGDDILVCQVTSKTVSDHYSVAVSQTTLRRASCIMTATFDPTGFLRPIRQSCFIALAS